MRKFYFSLFSLLLLITTTLNAQVSNYTFSQVAGTYTPITGGTLLGTTSSDDQYFVNPAVPAGGTTNTGVGLPIGFNFTYNNLVFDRFGVNNNGWIALGQSALATPLSMATTSAYTVLSSTATNTPAHLRSRIAGMGRDLQAQTGSSLRYETIGTAPNRVLVVQFTNYKKYGTGGTGDNLNFQIRLYETTNIVEIVYGTIVFNSTTNTADVGLGGTLPTDFNNRTTTTDWMNSAAGTTNTSRMTMHSSVTPPATGTTFRWTPPTPCSGTPDPGNTLANVTIACSGVNFTLSVQNNPAVSGLSFQWQSSTDGTTWTNIAGATTPTLTTSQTAATWYRLAVTCSGVTGNSEPLQLNMDIPTNCYCIPPATNCTIGDEITNVTVSTLNNTTTCGTDGYTNYTATIPATELTIGVTHPMSVTVSDGGTEYVGVWIDYDRDGVFEASEFTALGSGNDVTINGNLTIPASATPGPTRMRVRVRWNTALTGADACAAYTYGETEDYLVNIAPCIQGTISTQPANTSVACGGTTTFTVAAAGSGLEYQWEYRTGATAPWQLVNDGGVYSGATTNTLSITGATTSLNGYQYRALIEGGCTALFGSNAATLSVSAYIATVSPVSATICTGGIQQLSITNTLGNLTTLSEGFDVAEPLPAGWVAQNNSQPVGTTGWFQGQSATFPSFSGAPDSYIAANYQNTDPVGVGTISNWLMTPVQNIKNGDIVTFYSRIPAGAEWADRLEVRLSTAGTSTNVGATSTSVGDFTTVLLTINPTLTLNVYPKVWTQFTATISGLAAPTTGRIAFRYFVTSAGGGGTNSNFIGIDDVRYISTGALASGVWSGPAGTMFTDAGATTAYDGTSAVNTIYVQPTAAGVNNYSVIVTTAACVSGPTTVPVTVNTAVTNLSDPVATSTCEDGSADFSVTADGTGITYQWQVSEDGGTTWSNLANGGNYSGATSATLNIDEASAGISGNQYRVIASVAACSSSVTSAGAVLTVNPQPSVNISAAPYTSVLPGMTTTLTANVSPNAGDIYSWTFNGLPLTSAPGNSVPVTVDGIGEYTVTVQDVNGCVASSQSFRVSDSASTRMFVYPSPNTGQFQVRFYSAAGNSLPRMLNIYDSKGARIYTATYPINTPYQSMQVDISKHGKGVYMIELTDRTGVRLKTDRVVVL